MATTDPSGLRGWDGDDWGHLISILPGAINQGWETGKKAVINGLASAVANTITLGGVEKVEIVPVTNTDRLAGHDAAASIAQVGGEIGIGVSTGMAASTTSKLGKAAFVFDMVGNGKNIIEGTVETLEQGWSLGSGVKVVGGLLGLSSGLITVADAVAPALKKAPLHEVASEIRTSGHPIAANRRTVAVGEDAHGNLYVGSSNGLDSGMKEAAKRMGVEPVESAPGLHAEEELMKGVKNLRRVGTSKRYPCGPNEHDCLGQMQKAGVGITNPTPRQTRPR